MINRDELVDLLPRLRRYARLLTRDGHRADDLTHDTVARAIDRESTFSTGYNLRGWLFTIMRNLFLDQVRVKDPVDWSRDSEDVPELQATNNPDPGTQRDLRYALEALAPEHREVLLLVAVEGLRYREAAELLGVPIGTVMSRLARARERMRELMSGEASIEARASS